MALIGTAKSYSSGTAIPDPILKKYINKYFAKLKKKTKVPIEITNVTLGDINMDGQTDAIVDYTVNEGAPGNFTLLYALVIVKNGKECHAIQRIDEGSFGDNGYEMQSKKITKGVALFSIDTYSNDDPTCCPSIHRTRRYRMIDGILSPID